VLLPSGANLRTRAGEDALANSGALCHRQPGLERVLAQLVQIDDGGDDGNAWYLFGAAATDATRQLSVAVGQDQFPYWVKRLGIDDAIVATFAVIDWTKNKLTVAPATVAFVGDAQAGWTMAIDQGSPVFAFLKKYKASKVYMAVSYKMTA
jgi:hypothetical protein